MAHLPARVYRTLCRFDAATELDKAVAYRDAEVPFHPGRTDASEEQTDAVSFEFLSGDEVCQPPGDGLVFHRCQR